MNDGINREFRAYRRDLAELLAAGNATEHSYRPALQRLVQLLGGDQIRVVNEPTHVSCGAPDFIVERRGIPIGHIECKDIGADLNRVAINEQLTRYKAGLPNLILTDYLDFRWYAYGDFRAQVSVGSVDGKGEVAAGEDEVETIIRFFNTFLSSDPPTVSDPQELVVDFRNWYNVVWSHESAYNEVVSPTVLGGNRCLDRSRSINRSLRHRISQRRVG